MLIIGGGIGGLAAALALARVGIECVVLERRHVDSEAGAGIQIGPNGTRVLQGLGLAAQLAPNVGVPDGIIVHDGRRGREILRLPLGGWIAARHGTPYWTAHRQDLHGVLASAAATEPLIRIEYNIEIMTVTDDGRAVTAKARDGRTLHGHGAIGADGQWSRLRAGRFPGFAPRFIGKTAARTVIAAERAPTAINTSWTGLWLAPKTHLVHYPVRGGREIALVLVVDDGAYEDSWARDVTPGWIDTHAAGFAQPARALLATTADWKRWNIAAAPDLPHWSEGRVTLLGDAAHPTRPFLAQGAVMALEDAVVLAGAVQRHTGDVAAAFADYQRLRIERTRRIVATAARNGQTYHLDGVAAMARDMAMRVLGGERLMTGYDWLYGWRAN